MGARTPLLATEDANWSPPTAVGDPLEAREALRQRVCGAKPAFGVKAAHRHAEQLRRAGQDVSAYRCVFCRRWHVGPAPSMETIEALARVIRGLAP